MKLFQHNKQESIQPREHKALYILLSFLLPLLLMLVALVGLKVSPFGDNTLIISDGNGLYVNFLAYVGRAVKGQEGLLFSFEKGLGGNMMSSWAWFLLNPFFALFSLFDITAYPAAYTWVSLLNFSVCGVTMYLLLADLYGHKLSNLIFSTSYALIGFNVANIFQMNFFTGVPTLPIMVLGLRRIFQNKNPLIYILALTWSLLTNFYFGFMLCAASLLLFTVFFAAYYQTLTDRKSIIFKYVLSSLLAGALSAVVWLPALLSMKGGRLDQPVAYAISFRENMPFLDMAAKLFSGANTTAELINGLPNIFVGILPISLVILFFMNERIERKRKAACALLLIIYLISFYIPAFNLIMHGGTTTNWFNFRDSFVFSFLLLVIAAEQWQYISEVPKEHIKRAALILVLGVLLVFSKCYEFVIGGAVLLDLMLLLLMYLALYMHMTAPDKNPKRTFEMIVLVLVSLNLFLNYRFSTKNISEWQTTEKEYQEIVTPVTALVDAVKMSDAGFYRMEIGEQRSGTLGNDPMLYGYNGVGHGGSDDRDFVRSALNKLGVHRFDMRNSYGKGISAATDTLLGLKYLISKEDLTQEKNYEKLIGLGEWSLYRNKDALPVALLADAEVENTETDFTDVFDNLNRVWAALSGINKPVFIMEEDISFASHNYSDPLVIDQKEAAEIVASWDTRLDKRQDSSTSLSAFSESGEGDGTSSSSENTDGSLAEAPENGSYIEYSMVASRTGALYGYNRSGVLEKKGAFIPALLYDGYYQAGDKVTRFLPSAGIVSPYLLKDVAGRFRAAYADNEALHELAGIVRDRPCTIEKLKESHLCGSFTAEAGQKLLFTIPYDEGWTCLIDGKEAEIRQVLGVFMAVDAPEGAHSYEMKFFPIGMKTGMMLSAAALLTTAIYIPVDRRRRKDA